MGANATPRLLLARADRNWQSCSNASTATSKKTASVINRQQRPLAGTPPCYRLSRVLPSVECYSMAWRGGAVDPEAKLRQPADPVNPTDELKLRPVLSTWTSGGTLKECSGHCSAERVRNRDRT